MAQFRGVELFRAFDLYKPVTDSLLLCCYDWLYMDQRNAMKVDTRNNCEEKYTGQKVLKGYSD